jgi:hypothetical protein
VRRDLTITIKIGGESSMKGVAVAALVAAALLACMGLVMANPPLTQPLQYEQFCENQKVAGTGVVDISTSIVDKKIALEYYNVMAGDGDLELDQTHAYSQKAEKLQRNISAVNDSQPSMLNLFENTKLTYNSATTPLTGGKYINSKAFYGGIGADVQEMFSVNQMEKDQTAFFVSTANISPDFATQADKLKQAGQADVANGNEDQVKALMQNNPAHLIGMDTKNSFNGTWGVDAKWHQIFYKDIKLHEMFTGKFEAEKLIKFHEYPVPENVEKPCAGIDC